jgi:hypothetical protein
LVKDRVNCLNAMLCNYSGERHLGKSAGDWLDEANAPLGYKANWRPLVPFLFQPSALDGSGRDAEPGRDFFIGTLQPGELFKFA